MFKTTVVFCFLMISAAHFLSARPVTIQVIDTDLAIPLEGAVVWSSDGQQYECDQDGNAMLQLPDDTPALIQITYPGYDTLSTEISPSGDTFVFGLTLSFLIEGQELVIAASRPGVSETRTGRSVAITETELSRNAEVGIIEDVITAVKLLPGVGYSGLFNAQPSIRGGEPGDLMAVMNGFYIDNPYHWGGAFSIFDPRMVQSVQLSHGVFSARYGHTTSGLLEITSKQPDPRETELEVGISSSATNLNLSFPLNGKGGIIVMGKLTYWDPFVWLVKQMAPSLTWIDERIELIDAVSVAPYIRSGAFAGQYRPFNNLEFTASGYIGGDGVGADYQNPNSRTRGNWENWLGFLTTSVSYSLRQDMAVRASLGTGFHNSQMTANIDNWVEQEYSEDFLYGLDEKDKPIVYWNPASGALPTTITWYDLLTSPLFNIDTTKPYHYANQRDFNLKSDTANFQVRGDFDWDWGQGLLFSAGIHEMGTLWMQSIAQPLWFNWYGYYDNNGIFYYQPSDTVSLNTIFEDPEVDYVYLLRKHVLLALDQPAIKNFGLFSSGYTVLAYTNPDYRIGAEIGLRLDHVFFKGRDFSIQTMPVFNPRLNLDYTVFTAKGFIDSLALSIGTGLFSSMNDSAITYIEAQHGIDDYELKQEKTWTSILGAKLDFLDRYSFNLELYYKYGFDRSYQYRAYDFAAQSESIVFNFNGLSHIFGFDFMLQKKSSRFLDGWITYSFNWAQHNNPDDTDEYDRGWFYPAFHRFHNLHLVLNYKPTSRFNVAAQISYSSGALRIFSYGGTIVSVPVLVENEDGSKTVIQQYSKANNENKLERDGFTLPINLKFSWYVSNPTGKTQLQIYLAVENLLAFWQTRKVNNTTFNTYTGAEETGSTTASYDLPVPMVSFGFTWSY
ncbi:MAG: TonB-dependent receptor plug domain-containing protein [Spirochaetaceae bacterium]|jgi:hypothetical protein|nr:TonB-dependent receptor plug domain-containing protein [Spirochaetaceae bacterium]